MGRHTGRPLRVRSAITDGGYNPDRGGFAPWGRDGSHQGRATNIRSAKKQRGTINIWVEVTKKSSGHVRACHFRENT